jgi:hypothetical protein
MGLRASKKPVETAGTYWRVVESVAKIQIGFEVDE